MWQIISRRMPMASSSAYERKRMANITKNNAKLAELGLADGIVAVLPGGLKRPATAPRKRKRAPSAAPRRSAAPVARTGRGTSRAPVPRGPSTTR